MTSKQRMGNRTWMSGVVLILVLVCKLEPNFLLDLIDLTCGMIIWTGVVERVWGDA